MTTAWLVRAGRDGERVDDALTEGLVILGWRRLPNLNLYRSRDDLRADIARLYEGSPATGNWTGQLWRFCHEMADGDLVVMPLKRRGLFAIGEVAGSYRHRPDAAPGFRHSRPVHWLRTDVKPKEFDDDLRDSMGSLLTVAQLSRHNAPQRIAEVAAGRPDPGWHHESASVDPDATLDDLWQAVNADAGPVRLTVRDLLAKWGFTRRTATSQAVIQADLNSHSVVTRPPFITGAMDSLVELVTVPGEPESAGELGGPTKLSNAADGPDALHFAVVGLDETDDLPVRWLVSTALPTGHTLETVHVDDPLSAAVTLMLAKNYSQLAVVDDHGHYQGAVSWESVGHARMSNSVVTLRDATAPARVVDYHDDLYGHIDEIYLRGFVLVRGADRGRLVGIVTSHDLARQFGALARPFSLVEEAELRLRRRVQRLLPEEIDKHVHGWAHGNLTFGQYKRILGERTNFERMGWPLDHTTFLKLLEEVHHIRNELMHFSKDTLPPQYMDAVEGFVRMLRAVDQ